MFQLLSAKGDYVTSVTSCLWDVLKKLVRFCTLRIPCAGKSVYLGPGDARHFRAKTRKRAAKRENAKTAKTRTEVQERESWTAMIISGSSGTSMQNNYNNYIALQ